MKTFDEAVDVALIDDSQVDELFRANVRALARDVRSNDTVKQFMATLQVESDYSHLNSSLLRSILTDLYSAFHMGVAVGMEMEKPADSTSTADAVRPSTEQ